MWKEFLVWRLGNSVNGNLDSFHPELGTAIDNLNAAGTFQFSSLLIFDR